MKTPLFPLTLMVALSILFVPPTASARGGHKGHSSHHGHHGGHPHGHIGSHRRQHYGHVGYSYGWLGLLGYRSYPWYRSYSAGYPSSLRIYRGPAISLAGEVQIALARRGYYRGPIDGLVGSGSRRALRAFQRDAGLPVNGRIDRATVDRLGIGYRNPRT